MEPTCTRDGDSLQLELSGEHACSRVHVYEADKLMQCCGLGNSPVLDESVVTCCRKSHYFCSCLGLSAEGILGQDQWSAWCCPFMDENICACRLVKWTI